jgi:hypothetical protein
MSITAALGDAEALGDELDLVRRMSRLSSAEILLLVSRRLKNNFFRLAVVPNFTSDHERRMYSWIAALIHHTA